MTFWRVLTIHHTPVDSELLNAPDFGTKSELDKQSTEGIDSELDKQSAEGNRYSAQHCPISHRNGEPFSENPSAAARSSREAAVPGSSPEIRVSVSSGRRLRGNLPKTHGARTERRFGTRSELRKPPSLGRAAPAPNPPSSPAHGPPLLPASWRGGTTEPERREAHPRTASRKSILRGKKREWGESDKTATLTGKRLRNRARPHPAGHGALSFPDGEERQRRPLRSRCARAVSAAAKGVGAVRTVVRGRFLRREAGGAPLGLLPLRQFSAVRRVGTWC